MRTRRTTAKPRDGLAATRSARAGVRIDADVARQFSQKLRAWFRRAGRKLPWRETRDPYRILVSEAMLQQTQVSRVLDYYERFLTRFPTLDSLAAAPPRAVRESWDGLGYYARARNLHSLARTVDALPSDPEALRQLPGVGAYTAGAVASFAFEKRAALVDTNVARVVRRVFAPRADFATTRGRKRIWTIAESVLPRTGRQSWVHNQAIMELGALVCTARVAKCEECPVVELCSTGKREMGRGNGATPGAGKRSGSGS